MSKLKGSAGDNDLMSELDIDNDFMAGAFRFPMKRLIDDSLSTLKSTCGSEVLDTNDFDGGGGGGEVKRTMTMLLKIRNICADAEKPVIGKADRTLQIQILESLKILVLDIVNLLNANDSTTRAPRMKKLVTSSDFDSDSMILDTSDTIPWEKTICTRSNIPVSLSHATLGERIDLLENECKNLRSRQKMRCNYYGVIAGISDVYGRDDDKENVTRLLTSDALLNKWSNISVISITGGAGVGKTALAHIVYKDLRVHEHFGLRAWVSVPELVNATDLIEAIVGSIGVDHWYERELDSLVSTLRNARKDKRFLLVLDDVNNQDQSLWGTLLPPLIGGQEVKILITGWDQSLAARGRGFVQTIRKSTIYNLTGISASACWLLFSSHAFDAQQPPAHATSAEIGKKIVGRCDGFPLAVKMLGNLLRYDCDEEKWMNVLHSDMWLLHTPVNAALRICYDHLPYCLKLCFSYCSLYTKGYKFKKNDLVRSWIAKGLIQPRGDKTLEEMASENFDDLQRRSFFCSYVKVEDGEVDVFGMHDLVHELSLSVSREGHRTILPIKESTKQQFEHSVDLQQTRADLPQSSSQRDIAVDPNQMSDIAVHLNQTSFRMDEPTVYGREDNIKWFIEFFLSAECRGNNVSVIRIVAAGGVGKTSVAKLLYNHFTVCEIFETRAWVHVNERFDVRVIKKAIIESLTGIYCGLTELKDIQKAMREELMGKRFFLVLDDVHNDDMYFWSSLLLSLNVGAKGSVIIATTQNEKAVSFLNIVRSYELTRLSESNCWSIFLKRVFYGRDDTVHPDLIRIGKRLVRRCEGHPLVVTVLGGLLGSAVNENFWNDILEWNFWGVAKNPSALTLSYLHLENQLKHCFKYCSLFPKGYIFDKDHLIRLWMSQGLINHKKGERGEDSANEYFDELRVEDIANEYFDELLRRSFFQQSTMCDPKERTYAMHDLFHDLAQSVSIDKYLRAETCNLSSTSEMVLHVSVVADKLGTTVEFEPFKESRKIQTLLLINASRLKSYKSVFHVESLEILNDLFLHFRFLRTLDLSFTNIVGLPDSIGTLENLCYLGLNETNINKLPESICRLYNLQSLELQGCSYLSELPANMKYLTSLRHLLVSKESGFVAMPFGIGKLTSLQTLSTFTIGRDEQLCGIRELKDLTDLRGSLCIVGLGNVANGKEAKEAKLELKGLSALTMQWFNCIEDLESHQSAETAFKVLQCLRPHEKLEELTLCDYSGDQLADWMADPLFSMLTSITLDNCYECNDLPPLGQLPSLKHLSMRMMDGLQRVGRQFLGSGSSRGFPSLETLKLWEMYELEEWSGVEGGEFPCLRNLSLSRCDKLRKLPCFTYLEELSIHCCTELPDLPTLPCLKSLNIEGVQNLGFLSQQLDLPALEILEICACNQLLSLEGLIHVTSLDQLKITRCPKLNPSPIEQLPSMLRVMEIRDGCPLLNGWCPYGFKETSNPHQGTRKLARTMLQGRKVQ